MLIMSMILFQISFTRFVHYYFVMTFCALRLGTFVRIPFTIADTDCMMVPTVSCYIERRLYLEISPMLCHLILICCFKVNGTSCQQLLADLNTLSYLCSNIRVDNFRETIDANIKHIQFKHI